MGEEWDERTLGDLISRVRRGTTVEAGQEYQAVSVLKEGKGLGAKEPFVGGVTNYKTLFRVLEGDVVVRTITAFESPVAVAKVEHNGSFVSQVFLTYEVSSSASPHYLALYFQTEAFWREMQNRAQGTVMRRKTISDEAFRGIPITLPPPPMQRRIVDLVAHLDEHISALWTEHAWVKECLALRRAAFPVSAEAEIAEIAIGIDSGKSVLTTTDAPAPGYARIIKLSAVGPGIYRGDEAKALPPEVGLPESAVVREGDILITRSNTPDRVGFCARARGVVHGTYMPDLIWRVRIDEGRCHPDYFEQVMASHQMRSRVSSIASGTSSSMVKINKKNFGAVRIPLPDGEEQVTYADDCLALAALQTTIEDEALALAQFRRRLVNELMSGAILLPETYDVQASGVA